MNPSLLSDILTTGLGLDVEDVPATVIKDIMNGNPTTLTNWMDSTGVRVSKADMESLLADNSVPSDLKDALQQWSEQNLPKETTDALSNFSGTPVPVDILDALDEGNTAPYLNWLQQQEPQPSPGDLEALLGQPSAADLPAELVTSLNELYFEEPYLTEEAKEGLFAQLGVDEEDVPSQVASALHLGEPEAFIKWLEEEDVRVHQRTVSEVVASEDIPESLKTELAAWAAQRLPVEVVEALGQLAGTAVPESLLQPLDAGDWGPLMGWLEGLEPPPSPEDVAKLEARPEAGQLPGDFLEALEEVFGEAPPPDVGELARLAGVAALPPDVEAAVEGGDPGAFVDWLEAENIRVSANAFARLEAGQDIFHIPEPLMESLSEWYAETWRSGAVGELGQFAGAPVPKATLEAVEQGDFEAFTEWLDKEGLQPPPPRFLRLSKRYPSLGIPDGFMGHLDEWYRRRFTPVFTTTPLLTTTTAKKHHLPFLCE